MSTPTPRPALKKAADAHLHPAAPSGGHHLRAAPDSGTVPGVAAPVPPPRGSASAASGSSGASAPPAASAPTGHRLSGPLTGTTSDGLRTVAKRSRRRAAAREEKAVELTVKVPKSLRKEFRAAVKAGNQDPDEVVATLLRAWMNG
jgi:hypothetical protein